jgi:hypothetical protein
MRRRIRGLIGLALTLACGCASGPPPFRATRLEIEETAAGPRPWVRATVAGESMRLLLDTGAFQSVLPASFARARKLARRGAGYNSAVMDSNGRRVEMIQLADVPVQFEGATDPVALDFLQNPVAGAEEGILAPQELLRRGWAMVIDLERKEVRFEPEPLLPPAGFGPWRQVDYHGCMSDGPFNQVHRVVTIEVNGVPADMLVDTGATTTALARNNPAIPYMLARSGARSRNTGITSTGAGLILDDVSVAFGGQTYSTSALVVPASHQCWRGAIGTDLLRHCAILWRWSDLWVACRAPPRS